MAKKKTATGAAAPTFEEALARLESIVRELEEADLPLDRSLAVFEEGVLLSRLLHERLNEAERKVEILMKNQDGGKVPVPFPPGTESGAVSDDTGVDGGEDAENGTENEGEAASGHGQSRLPF